MVQAEGEFEKGPGEGAEEAIRLVVTVARAWFPNQPSSPIYTYADLKGGSADMHTSPSAINLFVTLINVRRFEQGLAILLPKNLKKSGVGSQNNCVVARDDEPKNCVYGVFRPSLVWQAWSHLVLFGSVRDKKVTATAESLLRDR